MLFFWEMMQGILAVLEIRLAIWFMEWFAKPRYCKNRQTLLAWLCSLGIGILYGLCRWKIESGLWPAAVIAMGALCLAVSWLFVYRRGAAVFVAANYILLAGVLDLIAAEILKLMSVQPGSLRLILSENGGYCTGGMALNRAVFFLVGCFLQKRYRGTCFLALPSTGKRFRRFCVFLCGMEYAGGFFLTDLQQLKRAASCDFLIRMVLYLIAVLLFVALIGAVLFCFRYREQLGLKQMYTESLDYENRRMLGLYQEREHLYHDLKNHLLILDGLVQIGKLDQYHAYMEQIGKPFQQDSVVSVTGNEILDRMLSYKIQEAREQQIHASCTVQGQLDFPLELADGEVCSLMGNLWDNALEACRRMTDGEKWIRFRLWIREGKLLLEMENSCTDVEKDGSGNLLTKKTEKKWHGIGLGRIRDIAERHGGYFRYAVKDQVFQVKIMIYLKNLHKNEKSANAF